MRIVYVVVGAVLVSTATVSCTQRHVRHWHELEPGMEKTAVRRLLGTPTAEMGPVTKAATQPRDLFLLTLFYGEVFDREGWVYNRPGLFSGLDNLFGPAVDAHVVYFDETGRVSGWREPLTKGDRRPDANARAFWRRYRELVCASDGAARLVEEPSSVPLQPSNYGPPLPRAGSADAHGTCVFEWDAPAGAAASVRYWLQIGIGEGESPATAPVHEWEPLTFATPRTHVRLEFGIRPTSEILAYWRVRAMNDGVASAWSRWQRIELRPGVSSSVAKDL